MRLQGRGVGTLFLVLAAILVGICFNASLAIAQEDIGDEDEKRSGFFHYLPAAPNLKLPDFDIVPFWTDDLKAGRKAYKKGDYARALRYFRRAADDGHIAADWYLGHMYRLGRGVSVDPAIAYSYYTRVAENYDPDEAEPTRLRIVIDSQLQMANYRLVGIPSAGIKADPGRAARIYLRIASTYGHPDALFALGVMNIKGEGMKKNPQQGLKWLTAAARKRHPKAQAYIGDLYWEGKNVKKDETRAFVWYILAAETAQPAEHRSIINRYNEMRWLLPEDERLEAEARARVWAEQYPAILAHEQSPPR